MDNKKTKKGFTLMELVIVIAIIGVLTSIVAVAWNNYLYATRLRSANTTAKVIFNAAQSECVRQAAVERTIQDDDDKYMNDGEFFFYWNGRSAVSGDHDKSAMSSQSGDARFAQAINKIVDEGGVYKIYVNNYTVQSVVYSPNETSRYLGAYPAKTNDIVNYATPKPFNAEMTNFDVDDVH